MRFRATFFAFAALLLVRAAYTPASGIPDTDFFWHLTYGRWILEHSQLPEADFFSWTFAGRPYQLTQWLGEVAIGAAYNIAGYHGTHILAVVLSGLTIGLAWWTATRYVHSSVALTLAVMTNTVLLIAPVRPQMFSFFLTSATVASLVAWSETHQRRYLACLIPMMMIWPNLHGGFVVGLILIGLFTVGEIWQCWSRPVSEIKKAVIPPLLILLFAVAATGVNPYGFDALKQVLMISRLQSSTVISEWQPVVITTGLGWCWLLMAGPLLGLAAMGHRLPRRWVPIASFALFFGYIANRQVAIAGAIMAPMLAIMISASPNYRTMRAGLRNPSRPILFSLILGLMTFGLGLLHHARHDLYDRLIPASHPMAAADFLKNNDLTNRVYSDTLEASYLIHRGIPVSIDGRMDLYLDKFFFRHYLAQRGAPGWDKFLEELAPQTLLLRNDTALRQLIHGATSWRMVFEDNRYSVYVPQAAAPALPTVAMNVPQYLSGDGAISRNYQP